MPLRFVFLASLFLSIPAFAQDVTLHILQAKHSTINNTQPTSMVTISGPCEPQNADITQPVLSGARSGNGSVKTCNQIVSTAASIPADWLWVEATMTDSAGIYRLILACERSAGRCPKLTPGQDYKAQRKSDALLIASGRKRPSKLLIRKIDALTP